MSDEVWTVRLAALAEADFADIVAWTTEHYGAAQARIYSGTVTAALIALRSGPQINGVKSRDDIGKGLSTLHVARNKRRGRHLILFRTASAAERVIEVLRILHDAMDVVRHVETDE